MVLAFLSFIYLSGWEQTVQKGETILWEINRDMEYYVDNFADKYAKDDERCAKSLRLFH
ncbi:MAG: hypothetical protein Q8M95_05455 [Candidatus Methanoperedens sp.]|nr:hypothetical protein [Candidatus Methanoperedens sp.]